MNKHLILLGLLACVSLSYGQLRVGLRGGAVLSNMDYEFANNPITTENIVTYEAGLYFSSKIGKVFGMNIGALYSLKGSEVDFLQKGELKIDYIDIPLMLDIRFGIKEANIFVEGGGYAGIAVNAVLDNGLTKEDVYIGEGPTEYQRLDYGVKFGGGINLDKIRLGVNYTLGLQNISNAAQQEIYHRNVLVYGVLYFN